MLIAAIYPIFRRIGFFRWLASNTMWFDFHLMAGTVGPMFVGLHSALRYLPPAAFERQQAQQAQQASVKPK